MDIAIITHLINSHSGSRAPLELALNLSGKNSVTIYAYKDSANSKLVKMLKKANVKIHFLPYSSNSVSGKFKNVLFLVRTLKKSPHQIISSHCLFPLFAATWFCQKPAIATYYGTQKNIFTEKLFPKKLNPYGRFLEILSNLIIYLEQWLIISANSKAIAISKATQKEALKIYRRKLPVIYLGAISASMLNEK